MNKRQQGGGENIDDPKQPLISILQRCLYWKTEVEGYFAGHAAGGNQSIRSERDIIDIPAALKYYIDRFFVRENKRVILIVCIDDRNGMMFHKRRLSKDRAQHKDMLKECSGKKLHMSSYSKKMFCGDMPGGIAVSEEFLEKAGEGEYCFIEDADISEYEEKIEAVILYRWNRAYPADVYFTLDLADGRWSRERLEEFEGFSHDRITKEVYKRAR